MELAGKYIKVKTNTLDDVFGTVVYKIIDKTIETKDGIKIKCMMIGGTGPSAKKDYPVWDLENNIKEGIKNGIIEVIDEKNAIDFIESLEK